MWLTVDGVTQHLQPGDRFDLPAGQPHAERYGPQGATYWVARSTPRERPARARVKPTLLLRRRRAGKPRRQPT